MEICCPAISGRPREEVLYHSRDSQLFFQAAEMLARVQVPLAIKDAIRLGRLTALRKTDGGVRGIVAGDIVRRLVARTISQQLMERVEAATAPFQYAMSTRAGCECVAHALQGITEMSATATITSKGCWKGCLTSSVLFCCGASVKLFLCAHVGADVAV